MTTSVRFFEMLAEDPEFMDEFQKDAKAVLAEFPEMSSEEREAIQTLELSDLERLVDPKPTIVECKILQISW